MSSNDTPSQIGDVLMKLVSHIPDSEVPLNSDPHKKAKALVSWAAKKAAATSGALALPPGPIGMLTILPDLLAIWKIQQQMIADIAAAYGKTAVLDKRTMLYCLFKHSGAMLVRDIVARVGGRLLVKRTSLKVIQDILGKVGIRVAQRVIGKGISRWIPLVGAAAVAGYAYLDTTQVGGTAIELFRQNIELEKPG